MKELITFVLKPLSFLPALAIMYIIYSFSGQTGEESGNLSYEVSVKIVEIGNQVLDKGLQDWEISEVAASIEYPVRKLAHMSEYFILAVAVSFPFYVYGLRGFPLMVVAGLICVGFAAGDEYHQSFVDGRGPSVIDVGIDSIGVFFGILTVRIVCFIFLAPARMLERRRRRLERKNARRSRTPRRSYGSYECRSAPANHYRYNSPEPREYSSSRKRRRYDDVLDDEYDDTSDDIVKINDHEYLVDGSLNLNEVNDEIDTHFESEDFESIGGLVLGEFSGVPKIKDKIEFPGVTIIIEKMHKNRIELLRLIIHEMKEEEEGEEKHQ